MDHFHYRAGELYCESVSVAGLAEKYDTPLFVYSRQTLVDHLRRFREAFAPLGAQIHFSVKSCQNLSILRLLKEEGAGFDVVSGGELKRALEAGAEPSRIVFAGVGKTRDEIRAGLLAKIGWFNVESEEELALLSETARGMNAAARIALRVNPDVDPHTHVYTTTGTRQTKFGVDMNAAARLFADYHDNQFLKMDGIHLHLGSPVNTVEPYEEAIRRTLELISRLKAAGIVISAINLGGGFGAHYVGSEAPSAATYAKAIVPLLEAQRLEVLFEPGRSIAANAGVLLARVLYRKRSGEKEFVIVDAAMTELIRPALYQAKHLVWPVRARGLVSKSRSIDEKLNGTRLMDVVGPVCESGDFLAKDRWLPPLERGDLLCIFTAGAYGMTMSSQYNSRPRSAEVLVSGSNVELIRRRETYDDLVMTERL